MLQRQRATTSRNSMRSALRPRVARSARGLVVRNVAASAPSESQGPQRMDDGCRIFIDSKGKIIQAMCCDYGFRSGTSRMYEEHDGEVPTNVFNIAAANFQEELRAMRRAFRYSPLLAPPAEGRDAGPLAKASRSVGASVVGAFASLDKTLEENGVLEKLKPLTLADVSSALSETMQDECTLIRAELDKLRLSVKGVIRREHERIAASGATPSPWYVKTPFFALCWVLDAMYGDERPIARFWVLETVARIPYFAYISILHLYESLGFWRAGAELRRVHFAEEWNELHHLQIMESLGGDRSWFDRFVAEHAALLYYWVLIFLYLVSPKNAYNLSELIEWHAVDTYREFTDANKAILQRLPPPMVALCYYKSADLYMFDSFQTESASSGLPPRRPECDTLYDVFSNIVDDEVEHVKTMAACQTSRPALGGAAASAGSKAARSTQQQ